MQLMWRGAARTLAYVPEHITVVLASHSSPAPGTCLLRLGLFFIMLQTDFEKA